MRSPSRDRNRYRNDNVRDSKDSRNTYKSRSRSRSRSRDRYRGRERDDRRQRSRSRNREINRNRDRDNDRHIYTREREYDSSSSNKSSTHHITPALTSSPSHPQSHPPSQSRPTTCFSSNRHAPLTTESLKERKLAALDQQKYLCDRQKDREAAILDKKSRNLLWPPTPPYSEFYMGNISLEDEEETTPVDEVVGVTDERKEAKRSTDMNDDDDLEDKAVDYNDKHELDDDQFGPSLRVKVPSASSRPSSLNSFSTKPSNYGGDMMPGEGSAMASFVASGQRIPRRGEIGLESNEIARFETAGFVMSGSRHQLMNAVRMRKENQVISTEEKKMIGQMALEERIKREEEIIKTFKSMVDEKLKGSNSGREI